MRSPRSWPAPISFKVAGRTATEESHADRPAGADPLGWPSAGPLGWPSAGPLGWPSAGPLGWPNVARPAARSAQHCVQKDIPLTTRRKGLCTTGGTAVVLGDRD